MFGAIFTISGFGSQEAFATEVDVLMEKMLLIDNKLTNMKNNNGDFNEFAMGTVSFEINQVQNLLLEINNINDRNGDESNRIYSELRIDYNSVLEEFQNDVNQYQRENGLTFSERAIVADIFSNKQTFENSESSQKQ